MQPLAIKYCGHFNMKYPMGKCVWGGLLQQLEEIGELSFVGNKQMVHQKYECKSTNSDT